MAPSTSANDTAGSSARSRRRQSGPLRISLSRGRATELISMGSGERGMDDALLRQFVAREMGDNRAVAKHIDPVAVLQLLGFGRIPEESAPPRRLLADQIVDL